MNVGLFIPCYVNQFYPNAARATLELLQKTGVNVTYPVNQTCCGQPMANSGFEHLSMGCNELFIENFGEFDYIVGPSASCVLHIKEHLHSDKDENLAADIRTKIYELVEFLTDVVKLETLDAFFPHKVGLHHSCHGLRGLHLSQMSELNAPAFSKPQRLLNMVKDRVRDHTNNGAEYITSSDLSCLMHLEGILHRNKSKVRVIHIAEILNATT